MNELAIQLNTLNPWESEEALAQIRRSYAVGLSQVEFDLFVSMGRVTGLNPFLREIWAVKYASNQGAQIFIGRDGYRKSAQRHPLYDYHTSDAVYSNDKFTVVDGLPNHQYDNLGNRGYLVGAYCVAQRKGSSRPSYVFVPLAEYKGHDKSLWGSKPATMIKKVAEAQCLRMCFQELFAGTFHESEDWLAHLAAVASSSPRRGLDALREKLGLASQNKESENIDFDEDDDITYEEVLSAMRNAENLDSLKSAGMLAKNLTEQEREQLKPVYVVQQKFIKQQLAQKETDQ